MTRSIRYDIFFLVLKTRIGGQQMFENLDSDFEREVEKAKMYYELVGPAVEAFVAELGLECDRWDDGTFHIGFLHGVPTVRLGTDIDASSPRRISRTVYLEFVLEPEPMLVVSVDADQQVEHGSCESRAKFFLIDHMSLTRLARVHDPAPLLRSRLEIAWRVLSTITPDDLLDAIAWHEDVQKLNDSLKFD